MDCLQQHVHDSQAGTSCMDNRQRAGALPDARIIVIRCDKGMISAQGGRRSHTLAPLARVLASARAI